MIFDELITLPLRVGVRAANLTLRVTGEAAGRAFMVAEQVVRVVRPAAGPRATTSAPAHSNGASTTAEAPPMPEPPAPEPGPPVQEPPAPEPVPDPPAPEPGPPVQDPPAPAQESPAAAPTRAPLPRLDQEPDHVSEEPVLVEEFADPGAEDGAGAEVTVDEPWAGYRQLTAQELIERLVALSPEELAAVRLYEGTHRRRDTVLTAVDHQLRLAS